MPHMRLSAREGLDGHVMWHAVTQTQWRIPGRTGVLHFHLWSANCRDCSFSKGYIGILQCVQA
jgi:hypothetical protein